MLFLLSAKTMLLLVAVTVLLFFASRLDIRVAPDQPDLLKERRYMPSVANRYAECLPKSHEEL